MTEHIDAMKSAQVAIEAALEMHGPDHAGLLLGALAKIDRAIGASRVVAQGAMQDDDPTANEQWNAGCDFALAHLCKFLGVDFKAVSWDAATETVDGDVLAVIGNILRVKFGEDWGPNDAPALTEGQSASPPVEVRKQNDAIDEICIDGGAVHIEQMSPDSWFMGVEARDGSYWQFWFGAKNRKSHVEFTHTEYCPANVARPSQHPSTALCSPISDDGDTA
ncbi:hypothetical protein [Bradyrhizobium elkanii]|uniref:hypothetical protein n=1 Tax=Bradyrhizobium elkanii TaxID=29448 RepID=UPI0014491830|nr:hypothetical protein [Bradyrhizobium elkanii]MCP1932551.1 hypothetical protein [Bradyrhizobium elkanii]MCS3479522.1 hypothetical protein [Bradyrhizobium elkanii]MCS3576907.1 hypothetical protein [Bradyrhizobium elkanii]MCS3719784.1 hypothetical protein [Bradyrhizobium elkanii]MCS4004201.1 hypothetical protein [Bradyrhizobium elkanii USDA 61]